MSTIFIYWVMKQFAVKLFHQTLLATWDTMDKESNFIIFVEPDYWDWVNLGSHSRTCIFCRFFKEEYYNYFLKWWVIKGLISWLTFYKPLDLITGRQVPNGSCASMAGLSEKTLQEHLFMKKVHLTSIQQSFNFTINFVFPFWGQLYLIQEKHLRIR